MKLILILWSLISFSLSQDIFVQEEENLYRSAVEYSFDEVLDNGAYTFALENLSGIINITGHAGSGSHLIIDNRVHALNNKKHVLSEKPLGENYMSWDRPLHFFTNLNYSHPSLWGVSARLEFESGRRYTRSIQDTIIYVDEKAYYDGPREDDRPYAYVSEIPKKNIDLKLYKTLIFKRFKIKTYAEIENLMDELIPRRINPYTGRGYDPGEIFGYQLTNSPNPNEDPSRYGRPRSIELGLQVIF